MYLITNDFKKTIQSDNLNQIIGNDNSILNRAQLTAQEEAFSYLSPRYDLDSEFTDTSLYINSKTYNAADRVYIDAPVYNATLLYNVGDLVLQAGSVYKCSTAILVGEVFNPAHWTLLGAQYDLFYVPFPNPVFNEKTVYSVGDKVFWKNKVYTALLPSVTVDYDSRIQANDATYPSVINVFPDDVINGTTYWGSGTAFSLAPGLLPGSWTAGDNRSQQMVTTLIDICLYHIHKRIAPRNIPELRVKAYDDAVSWLKQAMKGSIAPKLTAKQPQQGTRILWNSVQKQSNGY